MKTVFSLLALFLASNPGTAEISSAEVGILPVSSDIESDFDVRQLQAGAGCKARVPDGPVVIKVKKIEKATVETDVLTTWEAPFKTKGKKELDGTAFFTQIMTDKKTCVQNLILQVNKNTHLAFTGACNAGIMALVGGTGKYPCALGQALLSVNKKTFELDINKIACNC